MAAADHTNLVSVAGFCLFLLLLSSCFAEDKTIFLVLMEGDPLAFHPAILINATTKLHPPSSEAFKFHAKRLEESHDKVLESALETGSYKKLYSFKHVVNGFALQTTPSQAKKLESVGQVRLVERDRGAKLMTTYTPQFLGLPEGVWAQEGGERSAGEGIVVGVVDSGIDPAHPSFATSLFNPFPRNVSHFSGECETGPRFPAWSCNGKIISARFFSAGAEAVATLNASVDFLSPFDGVGHGSHVASIAAGNAGVPVVVNGFHYGQASGMAPRARVAVYKAVYPTIGTLADVIAAVDQATIDGVDILTLSVGPDELPEGTVTFLNVFDVAMLLARRAGIVVVQAVGNRGPYNFTVVSYSPWAIGVGATTVDRSYPSTLFLGNGQNVPGSGLSGPTFGLLPYRLVLARDAVRLNGTFPRTSDYIDECQFPEALDSNYVRGSIVICVFSDGFYNGTSTVNSVIDTARALGFMGFILAAKPEYGDYIAQSIPLPVSGILIPKVSDAQILTRYYEEQTIRDESGRVRDFRATAAIGEGRQAEFGAKAPVVTRYSSRGPDFVDLDRRTPADVLKPDFVAPGHEIWAAWSPVSAMDSILRGYNFALLSGTSMATPHVVGIAALLKQKYGTWSPSMIASAISTTATMYDNRGETIMAEGFAVGSFHPSTYFDLGSGFVNPARAIDPGLVVSSEFEDYIGFLCSIPNIDPSMVRAATGSSCTSRLGHPANLNIPSVTVSALNVSLVLHRNFTNVGTKPEKYVSSIIPPNGTSISLRPPWFVVAPGAVQDLEMEIKATAPTNVFSFGEILLTGSLNHIVRIPLSIKPVCVN